jgi:signal transduction histidine kinase
MLFGLLVVILALSNSLLTLLVFFKNTKNHINVSFTIFGFGVVIWILSNYFSNTSQDYNISLNLNKLIFISGAYIAYGLLYFSLVFPKSLFLLTKKWLFALLIPVLISNYLVVSNVVITDVTFLTEGGTGVVFGIGIYFFSIQFLLYLLVSIGNLLYKFKISKGHERAQIQYLLFGISILTIFGSLTNLLIPLLFNSFWISNFGPFLSLFVVGFTSYAIVKHRLMDIRLIVARTVAYSLIITCISTFYVISSFILSTIIFGALSNGNQLVVYTLLTIVVALSFEKLRIFIEKSTDKIFFRGHYSTDSLLAQLGHIMSSHIELESVSQLILSTILQEMRITRGIFVFLDQNLIYGSVDLGFTSKPIIHFQDIQLMLPSKKAIIFDELEESPVKAVMRQLNLSISKLLLVNNQIVGILLLGEKQSGDIYSDEDLRFIEIVAPEIAVTIENAKSYDKIKRFNVTLSEEIKRATSDLKEANMRLTELDRLKDDFVSVASHELRTPMTAIRSYVWMALNRSDVPLSDKMRKYLTRTLISTERLINLVNDMLNISRIEQGRIEILPSAFKIETLVEDVFSEVALKAREKNVHLAMLKSPMPEVFADQDKVHQILLNLVGNALKFTPAAGTITVSFMTDGKSVQVDVKDSGVGISKEDQPRLFQKFGRIENSYIASSTTGGTGLGLFICKRLIEMMGGRIWVSSEGLGKGTTFSFSLLVVTNQMREYAKTHIGHTDSTLKMLEPIAT